MFKEKIFVSLLCLALVLNGCASTGSDGGSYDHNKMGEYFTIIETGQIINKHENPNLMKALQNCREKAELLFRDKSNNIKAILDETDSCLKKAGYERMK